jgi:7-cyano-7-deazaguanine synthase in queuosine biosynthesis
MATEHHIFCGGIGPRNVGSDPTRLMLNLWKNHSDCNVGLTIEDLHKQFYKSSPPQFHDLLEIAAYIFCADQALKRGARDVQTMGENWRRHLQFHIPVRNAALWDRADVKGVLVETLGFLSDDFYEFTFEKASGAPPLQDYFNFDTGAAPKQKPEQVMMFSGGLDSLAGAIEEIVVQKRKVALVNHLATPKFSRRYGELCQRLIEKSGEMKPVNVRVEINKSQDLNKEYTQRSRSFLYASLGATVAMMLGQRKLFFYENGVVSLNLPVCAQVVGGRATRSTHPRVLAGFQNLLSLLADEPFTVENPFLWKTKGDVVKIIVAAECAALISLSRSCAHTWESTNEHPHCGVCSQCIDRRFGIITGKAEAYDPVIEYRLDVFTESLPKDEDKIMGAAYLEKAIQCENLKDVPQFITENPEVMRALRYIEGTRIGVAARILDLHKRHAKEVGEGLKTMLCRNADGVIKGTLPPDCLLRISYETGSPLTMPAVKGKEPVEQKRGTEEVIHTIGRFRYRDGFAEIWLGDQHYDLRERTKARLCIEYLVQEKAFDAQSARHFLNEIDPYVRKKGDYPPAADIKIDHYFGDQSGRLPKLRKELIRAAGRNGKFYLKTD